VRKELEMFEEFLEGKRLKLTGHRRELTERIFSNHSHFSAEGLLKDLRREKSRISRATVYRTLTLLTQAKLLEMQDFGWGNKFYEHLFGHLHHDHLVCIKCRRIFEVKNGQLENIQDRLSKREKFLPLSHSLKIYGLCRSCREPRLEIKNLSRGK
jgi:Fur family ferric uptake transcriptional regulator